MTQFAVVALGASARETDSSARRPTIVANPSSDRRFRSTIERFLVSTGRSPEDLQGMLRTRYPAAVVRRRGLAGERLDVWYVYRDGHWTWSGDDGTR